MSGPLSQVTYDQNPGYLPINLVSGDNLSISIAIPFDITLYTFAGACYDSLGTELVSFVMTPGTLTPTGVVVASIDSDGTALLTPGASYDMSWVDSTGAKRTFLSGPIVAVTR